MCGFAAIVAAERPEEVARRVQAMTDAQVHRGPDDEGVHVLATGARESTVGLGARRLAIIDLSPAGHQPMLNPDTGDVLAYNGEIYNAPELRTELEAEGFKFAGHSDTEVLLRGYEAWGRAVLDRLRGMFAFGLWDAHRQVLLLARDHLGIKPLYYSFSGRTDGGSAFVAASEIRALLASDLVDARIERRALAGYFAYGSVQEPFTILEDVVALPAGSWLEVGPDARERKRGTYWSIPDVDPSITPGPQIVDQGRALLERSVARHLLSDVPLGVFLSSGLDSTTVAGLAARASETDVHAFTVSMPEDESLDERPVAERAAHRLGLTFHDIPVDSATALDWVEGGLAAMDQPAMDGMNTYIVSRAVRGAGLTVALSGQGGDEVFGGYRSFQAVPRLVPLTRLGRALPATVRRIVAETAARPWGKGAAKRAGDLALTGPDAAGLTLIWRRLLSDAEVGGLGYDPRALGLSPHFLDPSVAPNGARSQLSTSDAVATVGRLETRFYLGNTLLRDGDVYGMANSLEIRVPMLDRDVVDWAFRLPGKVLSPRGAPPKSILRSIAGDLLADEQLTAPKRGFGLPLALWMKGPLDELRRDTLGHLLSSDLVDPSGIRVLEQRYLGDTYRSAWTRVWALMMLGHWLEQNRSCVRVA